MAGRGIGIKVFADLDMAAFAAVLGQMKSAFGKANDEIKGSQAARNQALAAMDKDMVASANRAAWAEVDAQKRAAEKIIADRRAANAELIAENKRSVAAQRAILMAPVAGARAAQADKEAVDARNAATAAEAAHAEAMTNSAAAASTAAVAYNRAGMAVTGGLVLSLGEGIKAAGQFSDHLNQMGAATDTTAAQLKALHDGLMNLGPQVGRSLGEMTDAAYMAAKANFRDTADQLHLVGVAAQLAQIEGAPLENTMKALTTSLNDFAIPAEKAAQVATMIKEAAGDSKVTLDEYAASVHNLEPIFKTFVGGNAAAAIPLFGQMNAMLAGVTQTGAGADQASQWLRNATMHLADPNKPQRAAIGALGGSADDMVKSLSDPNVGPVGVLSKMNDLIAKKLGPDGMVQLDKYYANKDAIKLEQTKYQALSPENQKIADQVQAGTMDKMTALRLASNVGPQAGRMADWQASHKTLTGFDPLMNKFQGNEGSVAGLMNAMTGSQSGFIVSSALFGNDESKSRLNKALLDQQLAHPENGGKDVGGWSEVANNVGVKTKELEASMKNLAISAGENLLPAFKSLVDALKSISDFLGHHQILIHTLITLSEAFAAIWIGGKIKSGISSVGDMFNGLIQKLGTVGSTAELTNAKLAASGPAAAKGAAQAEAATSGEIAAETNVGLAADKASASLAAEGPAAEAGAVGVQAAAAQEIAAETAVMGAAARAAAALSTAMGLASSFVMPAIGIGIGAGLVQDTVDPDDPSNGFTPDTTKKLTVPQGLPTPGSSDAEAAMAGGAQSGNAAEKWVISTNNKADQAARYAWLMNHPDEDKNPNFKPPADYGQNQDPNAPMKMPNIPGYGQHWVNGKGWVDTPAGMPDMPTDSDPNSDGTYHPDYMGSGAGGGGAGEKPKKGGKRSDADVDADLAALGVSPDGTAQDPMYVSDVNGAGGKGSTPGKKDNNPFDKFTHPDGLWGKNGLFGDVAGMLTVFLGELALGNPLGKSMEGFGGGNKLEIANNKAAISANRVQIAFESLKETLSKHDKDSPEGIAAYDRYKNAVLSDQNGRAKGFGMSSGRGGSGRGGGLFGSLFGSDPLDAGGVSPGDPQIAAAAARVLRNTGQVPLEAMPRDAAGIVAAMFPQIKDIGGTRMPGTAAPGTHEIGRTLDVMMPGGSTPGSTTPSDLQLGNQIYAYLAEHSADLGISSMIWQDQGRNFLGGRSGAPGSTWSGQSGHMNHIDVQFEPPGYRPPGGPLQGPGAIPGPPMTTNARGEVLSGHATGTPQIVPGHPSSSDDHLAMLPSGEMLGLAGGEGILNSATAGALGRDTINALNAQGSHARLMGFAPGGQAPGNGPNGPNNPVQPPAGGAAGSTNPPPPKPPKGQQGETLAKPGKSGKPQSMQDQTGSSQDPDETGAKRPGAGISGGIIGAAEGAAAMGADMFAPGSGAAVQIGMQEANRAIQQAGEVAATLVGELPIQTLGLTGNDLSGRSVSLMKSLPGKVVGGLMGAHPTSTNVAGVGDTNSPDKDSGGSQMVHQGDYTGVHVENMNVTNQDGDTMDRQLRQATMSVGGQHFDRNPTPPTG